MIGLPASLLQSDDTAAVSAGMLLLVLAPLAIIALWPLARGMRSLATEPAGRLPRDPAIGALAMLGYLLVGMVGATLGALLAPHAGIDDPDYARLARGSLANLLQVAAVLAMIASPIFVDASRASASPRRSLAEGAIGFALAMPVVMALGLGLQLLLPWLGLPPAPETAHETLAILRAKGDALFTVLTLAQVVVLVPLAEEAAWRGLLQPAMRRAGLPALAACAVSAALFAAIHWSVLAPEARISGLTMLVVLGTILGALRERTGGILAPAVLHGLFNAANVAIALGQA